MAADLGKNSNLLMQIDKIAYGVGALLAIVILLIPFFLRELPSSEIESAIKKIEERKGEPLPELKLDDSEKLVRDQWAVTTVIGSSWIVPWATDAKPAVVKLVDKKPDAVAAHAPGKISKLVYRRDAAKRKVFIEIQAERGEIRVAKLKKTTLLRKTADGEFSELADLGIAPGGLTYSDFTVKPGKVYAYALGTEVGDGGPAFKEEDGKKESEPLAMTAPIPFDFAVQIISAIPFDGQTGTPGRLDGEISFWDYAQGKIVKAPKSTWVENDTFGEKVDGQDRYKVSRIEINKVTIQDLSQLNRPSESLDAQSGRRLVDLPGEVTEGASAAPTEEKPAEPPAEVEQPKSKKADSKTPAKKDTKATKTGKTPDKAKKDAKDTKKRKGIK